MGGAELMAHEQAKALARMGHEVRAFAGQLTVDRLRHARADDDYEGLRVHRIAMNPEDYSPEYLNFLHPVVDMHFRQILEEFRPEIVHFHNLMGLSVKLPILARRFGARTVCTLHDFWGFCLRNTAVRGDGRPCDDASQCRSCLPRIHDGHRLHVPMRFRKDFVKLALDHVERFVAPSRFLADRYILAGFATDRITVMPNGIDVTHFRPMNTTSIQDAAKDHIRITYVGYFGAHKGVATLLDALVLLPSLLPPHGPSVILQLVGEGPEEQAYRDRIMTAGLDGRVRFLGKVPPADMPSVYACSDIIVLPSIWDENQPVCLMEAMAAGLPVIASRKGGIPELVAHGHNGLMFAAGDPRDLAVQLARLVGTPELRRAAGREGRQRVEDLSHERQAQRLVSLYTASAETASVSAPEIYAAVGSLRHRMADEGRSLADSRYPGRYFMPRVWVADCTPDFRGICLTGRTWSALRLLGVDAVIPLPRLLSRILFRPLRKVDIRHNDPG